MIARLIPFQLILVLYLLFSYNVFSQPPLPNHTLSISASPIKMNFGSFCITGPGGGTVTIDKSGFRTSTGNIALLGIGAAPTPALFYIKLCQGRNIQLSYPYNIPLSNGSSTLYLNLKPDKGNRFQVVSDCNFTTELFIGGTLTAPGNASPGTYTGNYFITFNQE